jgi:hypothetical protein
LEIGLVYLSLLIFWLLQVVVEVVVMILMTKVVQAVALVDTVSFLLSP